MANLNVQNRQNSFKVDTRFLASASNDLLTIYPSRYNKHGRPQFSFIFSTVSSFPRNGAQAFNDSLTILNFSTGAITGGDEVSPDFAGAALTTGNGRLAIVSISDSDVLTVTYGTIKSSSLVRSDFDNFNFPLLLNSLPLYAVLLVNSGYGVQIESVADLRPDFSNGLDAEDVGFTNSDNNQMALSLSEYLASDATIGQNQLQIRGTRLKAGDQISITSDTASSTAVVDSVQKNYPNPDVVTLTANLGASFTTASSSRVTFSSYKNLRQAFASTSRIIYDSGWVSASTGTQIDVNHNLGRNLFTYRIDVYFNTTRSMNGARRLTQFAEAGLTQTYGVGVKMNFNSTTLKFGNTAIFFTLNNSGDILSTVTNGYFRAIAVLN